MHQLIGIAVRVSVMYVYALILLRLSKNRTIHHFSPLDFVVATIIGDMFDDVFWSEVPLSQGLVGMTTIVLLHVLVSFASYKSTRIDRLVSSTPTLMIYHSQILPSALSRERLNEDEVYEYLRLNGEESTGEIEEGRLEPGADCSLKKYEEYEPAQKRDLAI